jgi:DNA-directed RNA polymerase specialized sigma24 family protein
MLAMMFDNHAEHLYEYCKQLVGDPDQAASVTEAAFIAARSVLENPENLRAWLFALARTEALSKGQGRAPGDQDRRDSGYEDDLVNTDSFSVAEIAAQAERHQQAAAAAGPELTDRQREVLNLVYRHGIRPDHLPAILGLPPEESLALLADAEAGFAQAVRLGGESEGAEGESESAAVGADLADGEPLAGVPESVTDDHDGGPIPMIRSRRLRLGVAAALPAAALAGVGIYLVSSSPQHPRDVGSNMPAVTSTSGAGSGALTAGLGSHGSKHHGKSIAALFPTEPQSGFLPVPSPTASMTVIGRPKPHRSTPRSSPSPSSSHPTPSPDPSATLSSPSPTPTPTSPSASTSPTP